MRKEAPWLHEKDGLTCRVVARWKKKTFYLTRPCFIWVDDGWSNVPYRIQVVMKYHLIKKKKKNINILSNRSGIDLFSLDACGIFSFEISRRGEVFCVLHCILKVF